MTKIELYSRIVMITTGATTATIMDTVMGTVTTTCTMCNRYNPNMMCDRLLEMGCNLLNHV
jgi:hypothetical protein